MVGCAVKAGDSEGLAAVLLQISQHAERLAVLDNREGEHHQAVSDALEKLRTAVNRLRGTVADQAEILASLDGIDETLATLAARVASLLPPEGSEGSRYQPIPTVTWWSLDDEEREEATARIRDWVARILLPYYGHLAKPARRLLGPASAVPPPAGLAVRAVVGAASAAGTLRPGSRRAGRTGHPDPAGDGRAADGRDHQRASTAGHSTGTSRRGDVGAVSRPPSQEAAHRYAEHGWPVFPVHPGGEGPDDRARSSRMRRQTTARSSGGGTATRTGTSAIATGAPGPDVLDIDRHGEASGFPALAGSSVRAWSASRRRRSARPAAARTCTTGALSIRAMATSTSRTSISGPGAATSSPRRPGWPAGRTWW